MTWWQKDLHNVYNPLITIAKVTLPHLLRPCSDKALQITIIRSLELLNGPVSSKIQIILNTGDLKLIAKAISSGQNKYNFCRTRHKTAVERLQSNWLYTFTCKHAWNKLWHIYSLDLLITVDILGPHDKSDYGPRGYF